MSGTRVPKGEWLIDPDDSYDRAELVAGRESLGFVQLEDDGSWSVWVSFDGPLVSGSVVSVQQETRDTQLSAMDCLEARSISMGRLEKPPVPQPPVPELAATSTQCPTCGIHFARYGAR